MSRRKLFVITVLVINLFVLSACKKEESLRQKIVNDLTYLAEIQDYTNLTVSIYWLDKEVLTRYPWTVEDLMSRARNKITLRGSDIEGRLNDFGSISLKDVKLVDEKTKIEARFYLLIESSEAGRLLEMTLFGGDHFYIVNGLTIYPSDKLLDAITPLLSEEGIAELELYRFWKKSNFK